MLWPPWDMYIYSIKSLKLVLIHSTVSRTPSHSCGDLQVEPAFSKINVDKTLNSHMCSKGIGSACFSHFLCVACLKCELCWQVPLMETRVNSCYFLICTVSTDNSRFQLQTSPWPMLFPLSEVPSCHSIYMRQEGFLAHPSRTEVKFPIIEIPGKYLSKSSDIPRMKSLN